jgi:hypothetical protein
MTAIMGLQRYHRKRDFGKTPEPKGSVAAPRKGSLRFIPRSSDTYWGKASGEARHPSWSI